MKSVDLNTRLIDSYLELLRNLSATTKLDLIAKLTQSLKQNFKNKENSFEKAFGAWDKNDSVEKLTKSIKASRSFNRKIEDL